MDPNAAYEAMLAAWNTGDIETAREHAINLLLWLECGGFPPNEPSAREQAKGILFSF